MSHLTRTPLLITALIFSGLTQGVAPLWAGEYVTEPVPRPTPEVLHTWRTTVKGIPITLTNSSRGSVVIPLEAKATSCGTAEFILNSGRVVSLGTMQQCKVNVFSQLDKLINRDAAQLRIVLNGQSQEIPLNDQDRIGLAQVANQSRDAFLLFQQELARAVMQLRPSPTPIAVATPTPVPLPTPVLQNPTTVPLPPTVLAPTPPPVTSAPVAAGQEFVIVGAIKEERSGAGSKLSVQAINRSTRTILTAQAKFDFFRSGQLVDTRLVAFSPSDVPSGSPATAQVVKSDNNWDRVTVSFLWQRP